MDKPPKLTQYAGVTNRYEDFVAVHINQTMAIHDTGSFLSWHRYFLWAFEQVRRLPLADILEIACRRTVADIYFRNQTLKNECGYAGT